MITKFNENKLAEMVEKHAKYQKVMLIYDKFTSTLQINAVYEKIKSICIFNKMDISSPDKDEIYNGYKMLIFLTEVDNFLQFSFNPTEFVVAVVGQKTDILPYVLNQENLKTNTEVLIFADNNFLDKPAFCSLFFNLFYNYLLNIYSQSNFNTDFEIEEISPRNLLSILNALPQNFQFVDVDILRKYNLPYNCLPIVDFVLIASFNAFVIAAKQHTLTMCDIYKSFKENELQINKYYSLMHQDAMLTMIELNFSSLLAKAKQTYAKVLQFLPTDLAQNELQNVIEQVKNYSKNSNGILNYLYLYNAFGE